MGQQDHEWSIPLMLNNKFATEVQTKTTCSLPECTHPLSYFILLIWNLCELFSKMSYAWLYSHKIFSILYDGLVLNRLINWDSLHARLNSHHEAWSYKKKKHKKVKACRKSVSKEPTFKRCWLILDSKPLRS